MDVTQHQPRPKVASVLWAFVAFAIGQAVLVANGRQHPAAMSWLTAGLAVAVVSLLVRTWPAALEARAPMVFRLMVAALLGVELGQSSTRLPGIYLQLEGASPLFFCVVWFAVLGVLAVGCLVDKPPLGRAQFPLAVLAFVGLGVWVLQTSPAPDIDVFIFQRDAATALLRGENPYSLRYPDIYGDSQPFYGPGASVDGHTVFGFPYPPMSLFLVVPFQVLFGDYRYSQLAAIAVAALLMGLARPGAASKGAALLVLLMPRTLFVLEQGWTEPLVVLALACVAFVSVRRPMWVPLALGVLLVLKQYVVVLVPLVVLLPQARSHVGQRVRFVSWLLVPGLLSLPLALWNWKDFWFDVAALQFYQPFRPDALSYLAWWATSHAQPSTVFALVACVLGLVVAVWRAPRTAAGFAVSSGLVLLLFFAFNKQAFANYYFFVVGAFACAAALSVESEVTS